MKLRIYGDIRIKFRAFGFDLGWAKHTIKPENALELPVPILPLPIAWKDNVRYDERGVYLNLFAELV